MGGPTTGPGPYHRSHLCGLTGKVLAAGTKQVTDPPSLSPPASSLYAAAQPLTAAAAAADTAFDACKWTKPFPPSSPMGTDVDYTSYDTSLYRSTSLAKNLFYRHRATTATTVLRPRMIVLPVVKRAPTPVFQSCRCRQASPLPPSRTRS